MQIGSETVPPTSSLYLCLEKVVYYLEWSFDISIHPIGKAIHCNSQGKTKDSIKDVTVDLYDS